LTKILGVEKTSVLAGRTSKRLPAGSERPLK
jgi:hypothetical protein